MSAHFVKLTKLPGGSYNSIADAPSEPARGEHTYGNDQCGHTRKVTNPVVCGYQWSLNADV
ncbi:uncharacterized protein N7483_012613 [Penicillium malachiteum]|uniref:uncharacterized protein n=1 Tax=Penicillium malachiteum TaxID=1324776 RepID=UPI002546E093|nr:uncharacterized protein N7483_012613 [Penicillium malachiteum]KAJ5715432.1 hypothetical protein N7483_012613 [Penicillium malachiteum]